MTEEQIRQNAEEYATDTYYDGTPFVNSEKVESFIAGAHSRDEEIGTLEGLLKIKEHEIKRLRNPWISVEERLPEKEIPYETKNVVLVRSEHNGIQFAHLDEDGVWRDEYSNVAYKRVKVTHWMPIPELKGDEK